MKVRNKKSLSQILKVSVLLASTVINTNVYAADQNFEMVDEKIHSYVDEASAVIYIPHLTRGSLLQMRGAFGSANFTRKSEDNLWCDIASMRVLFGDFDGDAVGISNSGAVVLLVMNPDIAYKLARGQDIVGDQVVLLDIGKASQLNINEVDILVAGGASADSGLILNSGQNFLNDIFGASSTDNACEHKSAKAALDSFEVEN